MHSKRYEMEPPSSSEESIRFSAIYATEAKRPMPAMLNACRVALFCG